MVCRVVPSFTRALLFVSMVTNFCIVSVKLGSEFEEADRYCHSMWLANWAYVLEQLLQL